MRRKIIQPYPVQNLQGQFGISLIESMVAIVVMALGILGILGVQMRTLADTQTSVRRAQATQLIEDLGERMKVNPNALSDLNNYVSDWDTTPATGDCVTKSCTHTELALYDLSQWKIAVKQLLPLGDANVFLAEGEAEESSGNNRRQLGVMISWRENERIAKVSDDDDADTTSYRGAINASLGSGNKITCPPNRICHLQYLAVSARCAPYLLSNGTFEYFCPEKIK